MTIETISGTSLKYYLVAFDENGKEREEGKTSQQILDILSKEQITDIFIFSHGWMGDVPGARNQYSKWIGAMAKDSQNIEQIKSRRPEFRPLMIGIHWPSLQWGDENLDFVSFDATDISPIDKLIEEQAQFIADTEASREALRIIFASAMDDSAPNELPPEVKEAYEVLLRESNLKLEGADAAPGADWESFDPEIILNKPQVDYKYRKLLYAAN